jgi:hypothetical protein
MLPFSTVGEWVVLWVKFTFWVLKVYFLQCWMEILNCVALVLNSWNGLYYTHSISSWWPRAIQMCVGLFAHNKWP